MDLEAYRRHMPLVRMRSYYVRVTSFQQPARKILTDLMRLFRTDLSGGKNLGRR